MFNIACDRRLAIAMLVASIIFGNHYVRDCVGALEKQMEEELAFTQQDYSFLNALYFFPNMITPLLAGIFTEWLGGVPRCFMLSTVVVSIGHLLFGLGVSLESKATMFAGKALSGSMYEIIDALMPITYLSPIFGAQFPAIVGVLQIFLRGGSIANFLLSPIIYSHYGLKAALWTGSLVGCTAIPLFLLARYLEVGHLRFPARSTPPHTTSAATSSQSPDTAHSSNLSLSALCPPEGYSSTYYLYLWSGALMYGAIVPLWFFGSKYLQDHFQLSTSQADSMLTLPEGAVVVLGIPIGIILSPSPPALPPTLHTKLALLTASMAITTVAYACLYVLGETCQANSSSSEGGSLVCVLGAWGCVAGVGVGFALGCNVFWALVPLLSPSKYLSPSTGLLSCAVNLLPSLLPPLIRNVPLTLALVAGAGGGAALGATVLVARNQQEEAQAVSSEEQGEGGKGGLEEGEGGVSIGRAKTQGSGGVEYEMVSLTDLDNLEERNKD